MTLKTVAFAVFHRSPKLSANLFAPHVTSGKGVVVVFSVKPLKMTGFTGKIDIICGVLARSFEIVDVFIQTPGISQEP